MIHERFRTFNTKDTYPEQKLDNDLCQVVSATLARLPHCRHLRVAPRCYSRRNAAERVSLLEEAFVDLPNVRVGSFRGLLVDFAREQRATAIVKGLRAVSDYEYEIQMANMNARMEPNVETIFLMASDRHQFIASSLVKDIARLGGDTSQFVSKKVFQRLKEKFKKS